MSYQLSKEELRNKKNVEKNLKILKEMIYIYYFG